MIENQKQLIEAVDLAVSKISREDRDLFKSTLGKGDFTDITTEEFGDVKATLALDGRTVILQKDGIPNVQVPLSRYL